jgi:hypothetical protein
MTIPLMLRARDNWGVVFVSPENALLCMFWEAYLAQAIIERTAEHSLVGHRVIIVSCIDLWCKVPVLAHIDSVVQFLVPRLGDKLMMCIIMLTLYKGVGNNFSIYNLNNISSCLAMW